MIQRTEKYCSGCNATLPTSAFYVVKRPDRPGGWVYLTSRCRPCTIVANRVAQAKCSKKPGAAEKRLARERRRKYGISQEQTGSLVVAQGGKCAICLGALANFRVDHCHVSKKVRGLLCHPCNVSLGLIKDNPATADAMAAYLRKHTLAKTLTAAA